MTMTTITIGTICLKLESKFDMHQESLRIMVQNHIEVRNFN